MKAKAYLVVQARRRNYAVRPDGTYPVQSIRIIKSTSGMPALEADQEAVEVEIDFPDDYFDVVHPKIEVTVPNTPIASRITQTTAKVRAGRAPSAAAAVVKP